MEYKKKKKKCNCHLLFKKKIKKIKKFKLTYKTQKEYHKGRLHS